jgi:hypothetical protein
MCKFHSIVTCWVCVTIRQDMDWIIGFIDHLYTPLVTIGNYSAIANLHTLKFTTAPAKHFPACCLNLPFPGNGDFSAFSAHVVSSQYRTACALSMCFKTLNIILCCNCQLPTISLSLFYIILPTADSGDLIIFNCRFSTKSVSYYQLAWGPGYIASGLTQKKTLFPSNPSIVACVFVTAGKCLPSRCLAMDVC